MRITSFLTPLLLTFLLCEALLRAIGYVPISGPRSDAWNKGYMQDNITGWRNRERSEMLDGSLGYPGPFTFWPHGLRATGASPPDADFQLGDRTARVTFLGGSFTQAGGVPDEQTFPWLVGVALPSNQILNFGTGGHGTCQSYLRMKWLIEQKRFRNTTFIYGLSDFHEVRNIAHPRLAWRVAQGTEFKSDFMPRCDVDEAGQLQTFPRQIFDSNVIPLSNTLATSSLLEEGYYEFKARPRLKRMRRITERILLEMKALAEASSNRFIVLMQRFEDDAKSHYEPILKNAGIEYIDGVHPEQSEQSTQLIGDYHPNPRLNKYWADKIIAKLGS